MSESDCDESNWAVRGDHFGSTRLYAVVRSGPSNGYGREKAPVGGRVSLCEAHAASHGRAVRALTPGEGK